MIYAKLDDEPLDLRWFTFSIKIVSAIAWLMTSLISAEIVASPTIYGWKRAAAGAALIIPAFVWQRLRIRLMKRSDEFNRDLLVTELRLGNSAFILYGPAMIGVIAIVSALPHGQAALPHGPADLMRAGYLLLFLQPPLAFLFGASMTQFARWTYGRKDRA